MMHNSKTCINTHCGYHPYLRIHSQNSKHKEKILLFFLYILSILLLLIAKIPRNRDFCISGRIFYLNIALSPSFSPNLSLSPALISSTLSTAILGLLTSATPAKCEIFLSICTIFVSSTQRMSKSNCIPFIQKGYMPFLSKIKSMAQPGHRDFLSESPRSRSARVAAISKLNCLSPKKTVLGPEDKTATLGCFSL